VSLKLRDELRIVLRPDQVVLARMKRELTRRGPERHVQTRQVIYCDPATGDDLPWSVALRKLEAALPDFAGSKSHATVILSNHFMRYALIPWNDALNDAKEETEFARHFFRQLYGAAADSWDLRLSSGRAGVPQLACAVDPGLPEAVRAAFAESGISLRSIQPSLMAAYNSCRDQLQISSGWLVLHEAGNLCIALLRQGRWISVRTLRADGDWRDTLPLLLEREAYLTEHEAATDEVFLWAPELGEAALPGSGRWKFNMLQPAIRPGFVPEYDGSFAMALGG
jgi:hypothetical protein